MPSALVDSSRVVQVEYSRVHYVIVEVFSQGYSPFWAI
jgi:hypothetical protein